METWKDFLSRVAMVLSEDIDPSTKDEKWIFSQVKNHVRESGYDLEGRDCVAEVWARTLGIMHDEDFNDWIESGRITWGLVGGPTFDVLRYNSDQLRQVEKIQEVVGPEIRLAKRLFEAAIATRNKDEGGGYAAGASDFSVRTGGRHYRVTVRDDTYEDAVSTCEMYEEALTKQPDHPNAQKLKEKISALREKIPKIVQRL
jgi:hypothetical protein